MKPLLGLMLTMFAWVGMALAASSQDIYATMQALKLESKQDHPVIEDENQRASLVKHWAKALTHLDDRGLGDVKLQNKDSAANEKALAALKSDIQALTTEYQQKIRGIFLNNFKFKRYDAVSRLNRDSLATLFFPSRYNHKTKRPIGGILHYKQNISDSFFSENMVDAGLLQNFPELKDEAWIQDAQTMETELLAIFNIYRESADGVKFVKPKTKAERQSKVAVSKSHVPDGLHTWSASKREKVVRKFVRKLQKLDDTQPFADFKQDVVALLQTFEYTVKPILVDNVNQRRTDVGARANSGDLLGLFMENKYNHKTGKPISGKLKYEQDVSLFSDEKKEVGYLVDDVSLQSDKVIQQALAMEQALQNLSNEHKKYLKFDNSVMY